MLPAVILVMVSVGPADQFPGWLQPFVRNQPTSQFVRAARVRGDVGHSTAAVTTSNIAQALAWVGRHAGGHAGAAVRLGYLAAAMKSTRHDDALQGRLPLYDDSNSGLDSRQSETSPQLLFGQSWLQTRRFTHSVETRRADDCRGPGLAEHAARGGRVQPTISTVSGTARSTATFRWPLSWGRRINRGGSESHA